MFLFLSHTTGVYCECVQTFGVKLAILYKIFLSFVKQFSHRVIYPQTLIRDICKHLTTRMSRCGAPSWEKMSPACSGWGSAGTGRGRAGFLLRPDSQTPRFQFRGDPMLIAFQLYQTGNFTFFNCSCRGNRRVLGSLFSEGVERPLAHVGALSVTW